MTKMESGNDLDDCTPATLVNTLVISLFVDSWERLHIIKQECQNIEVSLKSFIKHIHNYKKAEVDGVRDISTFYKFNQSEKEYLFSLRGISNLKRLVISSQDLLVKHFRQFYDNIALSESPDLFRFVCLRDALTDISSVFLAQLRNYQMNLIQIRAHSPTVAPLPDILRRVNLNSYASFIQDYTRLQRHDLVNFLNSQHRYESKKTKEEIDKINENLLHIDIVQVWRHLISSFFYPIRSIKTLSDSKKVEGISIAIETAFFFLEFPAYMPLLTHEMAHFLVDKFDTDNKLINSIPFSRLLLELQVEIEAYLRTIGIPESNDLANGISKEVMVDIIAIYMQGPAYLYALFLQIVGVGDGALYRDYDDKDFHFIETGELKPLNIVPHFSTAVPWQLRLRVANYVSLKINVHETEDDVTKRNKTADLKHKLYRSINEFLDRYEESRSIFYHDFPPLNNQAVKLTTIQQNLFKIFERLIDEHILTRYREHYLSFRTYISDDTYKAINRMMNAFVKDQLDGCFQENTGEEDISCFAGKKYNHCKRLMDAKINFTQPVRVEDVAWQVSFVKAWCISCSDAGGLCRKLHKDSELTDLRISRYPSGKKSFILANESYTFKEALYSSVLNYPGMIDSDNPCGDNFDKKNPLELFRQRIRRRKHFWNQYVDLTDKPAINPWFTQNSRYSNKSYRGLLNEVVDEYYRSIYRNYYPHTEAYTPEMFKAFDALSLASPNIYTFLESDFKDVSDSDIQEAISRIRVVFNNDTFFVGGGNNAKKDFVDQLNGLINNLSLYKQLASEKYQPHPIIELEIKLICHLYKEDPDNYGDTEKMHIMRFNREMLKDIIKGIIILPEPKRGIQLRLRHMGLGAESLEDIENKIMMLIVPEGQTMNICSISLCRRDFRSNKDLSKISHINTTEYLEERITLPLNASKFYGGTLFGPYSFMVIQEDYYQNEEFKIWQLHLDNIFEFHAKSKIMIRVNMPEDIKELSQGSLNALIRLRLKKRGYHFLLLHEMFYGQKKEERWPLAKTDRVFISTGWEDIVLFLTNKTIKELETIQQRLYKTYYTDKMETLFIRKLLGLNHAAVDDNEHYHFFSLIKLSQTMHNDNSVYTFNKWFYQNIRERHPKCKLYNYYGQFDYQIDWGRFRIPEMDEIIRGCIESDAEIFGMFDDFQTVVTRINELK